MVTGKGISGRPYNFDVNSINTPPRAGIVGNYIFAQNRKDGFHPIYIGQGNLLERYNAALREGCVTDKEATHYLWHQNVNENARTYEESDLIGKYPDCMIQNGGCNKVQP